MPEGATIPHPAVAALARRQTWRAIEALPWVLAVAAYFVFPAYLNLGSQILIMILFTLSLDLVLGYAGIISLGHAAFFGVGAYTAGLLAQAGWVEPISGLIAAGVITGFVGLASGFVILRTHGLTLLMLTLAVAAMLHEIANKAAAITGGTDGLHGMTFTPLLGLFRFDLFGRTAYLYSLAVLLVMFLIARRIVSSPFGRSLAGIRENPIRMQALGAPVSLRLIAIYTVGASMAGIAGALLTQTSQFVALRVLSFEMSGAVLIMLILGGVGRLYGAFVGTAIYMIVQDSAAKTTPYYWYFWLGWLLVLSVLFTRGGLIGVFERARKAVAAWKP